MLASLLAVLDRHPLPTTTAGAVASLSATAVTTLEHIDLLLRVGTGAIGMLLGLLSLFIWLRKCRRLRTSKRLRRERLAA
ncbi:MAG TPA: hypothetical protein VF614_16690 [Chthoniobacteraceae bacterium]